MKELVPEPLTAAAFAPFGEVIEMGAQPPIPINGGMTDRFHDLCTVDVSASGGRAGLSIFAGAQWPQPIAIKMLERHPLGSQAFFPLQPDPWLVVVAEDAGGQPNLDSLRCFQMVGWQGVNYARGAWHHPLLSLKDGQRFLVVDRIGEGENLAEAFFGEEARAVGAERAKH